MQDQAAMALEGINLRAAISYINNGYALVPLWSSESVERWNSEHPDDHKTTKMPTLKNWQDEPVTTIGQAQGQWGRYPTKGIGIVAGESYGVLWLDADEKYGGLNYLADRIDEHGPFPKETLRNRTGGGGIQVGFAYPVGMGIRNSSNTAIGIDFRAGCIVDGESRGVGQCAVFPTVHPSGLQYRWTSGQAPWDIPRTELALPPDWVVELALAQQGVASARRVRTDVPDDGLDKLGHGQHHYEIKMLIRTMYDMGLSYEVILAEAYNFNGRRFEPPISDGEIKGWLDWIVKTHERGDPISIQAIPEFPGKRFGQNGDDPNRKAVKLWMRATEVDSEAVNIDWALQNVIPLKTVTALVAPPKEGKSEWAVELISALEKGDDFLGLRTTRCIVLYATEEDESTFVQKTALHRIGDNVYVIYWWRAQANDINGLQASVDELCRFIDEDLENPEGLPVYVILDTYAEWADFEDENLSAEQIQLMKIIRLASAERDQGFLVLFHAGNNGQLRGSSALRGSVAQIVYLRNPNPNDEDETKRVLKTRGRYPRQLHHLDFEDPYGGGGGYYTTSEFPQNFGKRFHEGDDHLSTVMALLGGENMGTWMSADEVSAHTGWAKNTAKKYLDMAVVRHGVEYEPGVGNKPSRWRLT